MLDSPSVAEEVLKNSANSINPDFYKDIVIERGIANLCGNLNYFVIILQYCLYKKMSEIQKCPNLVRGGGQHFSKMSQIQKCPKGRKGGVNPNWDIVPNFLDFLF